MREWAASDQELSETWGHDMMLRAVVASLAMVLALAGCAAEPADAPEVSPSPAASTPAPSASPSESVAPALRIPGTCEDLVPLATIHSQFAASFEPIAYSPGVEDPDATSFVARGGLTCLWGIPNSDAGAVTVFAARRSTATDEQQVQSWRSAGYSECPPFLDACFYADTTDEIGEYWTVHALVGGIELRVQATSTSLDPLLVVARAAATSMGYV